jgi:uncharacterized coiled-coil protein SlyX
LQPLTQKDQVNALKQNPGDDISELRRCVAQFKKQAQLLLGRFQRGEISHTEAQAEAKRIEEEVAKAERRATELEIQQSIGNRQ